MVNEQEQKAAKNREQPVLKSERTKERNGETRRISRRIWPYLLHYHSLGSRV